MTKRVHSLRSARTLAFFNNLSLPSPYRKRNILSIMGIISLSRLFLYGIFWEVQVRLYLCACYDEIRS